MPRFYFHLCDDFESRDEEGVDLTDADCAIERAFKDARAMACNEVLGGHLDLDHRIWVDNEQGETIATITFRDAVKVAG